MVENYVLKEAKEGILFLYDLAYENNNKVKNYVVDKENNLVIIKYMNGRETKKNLDSVDISVLRLQQIKEFKEMKEKILKKSKYQLIFTGGSFILYTLAASLLYSADYYFEGSIYALGSVTFFTFASKNYKLKRHMNLVEWICDNEQEVNQIINEEITSIPLSSCPYSEEICNEGISLNTISDVSDKQLKKLKKKVKNNRG